MKRATTEDVAKAAGVSRATVSYVLNNVKGKTISEETREKIMRAVKELEYKPNFFAKGLRTSSSKTVALILPSITDPTMPIMVKGVETATNFSEYSLLIHDNESIARSKIEAIETLCERAIDGVIYAYPRDSDDDMVIQYLVNKRKMPTVVIGKKYERYEVSCVRFDHYNAGEMIADYLYGLGHERIALMITGSMTQIKKLRLDGINSVLKKHGLKCDLIQDRNTPGANTLFFDTHEYELGFFSTIDLVEKGLAYTAIIGTNNIVAAGILNALKSKGIAVPQTVSVTSFGGYFISEIVDPKLTVLDQPFYDFGKTAFDILKVEMENREHHLVQDIVYKPRIIIRGSTGRCKA